MGACLSSSLTSLARDSNSNRTHRSAYVISINGDFRQYPLPVTVSQVLESEPSSPSTPSFLCNSDRLYIDDYIPSLNPDDHLQAGQIYFVLPAAKLQYKLNASDMAALAVKASAALEKINRRRKRKARISPVMMTEADPERNQEQANINQIENEMLLKKTGVVHNNRQSVKASSSSPGLGVSRSGSVRKLQRYSSRRAKLAVRSFRMRLTTIYEGSVLLFN